MMQIVNTAYALAEMGHTVTLYTKRMKLESREEVLAFYGVEPHENMSIVPIFAKLKKKPLFRQLSDHRFHKTLRRELQDTCSGEKSFVIIRDEEGLELFDKYGSILQHPHRRLIYESHRICYSFAEERLLDDKKKSRRDVRTVSRLKSVETRAIGEAHGIICVSKGLRDEVLRRFKTKAPTMVLPSGTGLKTARDEGKRDIDILYMGKPIERNGIFDLIAAMEYLPEYKLCVVGGDKKSLAACMQTAGEKGVLERIAFEGFIEPSKTGEYLAHARAGVCPLPVGKSLISEIYGSPMKILEMMVHGIPVVSTDIPSVRELVDHNKTALLVDPGNSRALADAIRTVLTDSQLAKRLVTESYEKAKYYCWENRAKRLADFLETIH